MPAAVVCEGTHAALFLFRVRPVYFLSPVLLLTPHARGQSIKSTTPHKTDHTPPGPIEVHHIVKLDGTPVRNQRPGIHYYAFTKRLWGYMAGIYGVCGGEPVVCVEPNIYSRRPGEEEEASEPTPAPAVVMDVSDADVVDPVPVVLSPDAPLSADETN